MKRRTLNHGQKKALLQEFNKRRQSGERVRQSGLAAWAKEAFDLDQPLSQPTISRILNQSGSYEGPVEENHKKRRTTGKCPDLEDNLADWVNDQYNRGRPLSGAMIQDKARSTLDEVNKHLPPNAQITMSFSNGWLARFKKRFHLKCRPVHPDNSNADARQSVPPVVPDPPTQGAPSTVPALPIKPELSTATITVVMSNATSAAVNGMSESIPTDPAFPTPPEVTAPESPPAQPALMTDAMITTVRNDLRSRVAACALRDVWTVAEFGLVYSLAPDRKQAALQLAAARKDRGRMTFLACANLDASERVPLRMVGKYKVPRSFRGKSGPQLGFDYVCSSRAWVTSSLFYDWLRRLDDYISGEEGRRILLLTEQCNAHGSAATLPALRNIEVHFLPPQGMTQDGSVWEMQPFDHGAFEALKMRYRQRQLWRAYDFVDLKERRIFDVDQITAMRWIADEWQQLEADILRSSFSKCDLNDERLCTTTTQDESNEILRTALTEMIAELVVVEGRRVELGEWLMPEEENICKAVISDSSIVDAVLAGQIEPTDAEASLDAEDSCVPMPDISEQLRCLATVRRIVDERMIDCTSTATTLRELQRQIRLDAKNS